MKHLKMAGLAAVAAMAFMAWLGAGTASANLCTETPAGGAACPVAERINATTNSHIQGKITHGKLFTMGNTNGEPLITCTEGKLTATMISNTTAELNTLTFESCEGSTNPNALVKGTLHISNAGEHKGTVTATNTEVTVNILGVSCTYGVTGENSVHLGTISGSTLNIATTVKKTGGGFLCPNEAGWDTSGHLETPKAIYWINAGT
jgi:hypothetical protein